MAGQKKKRFETTYSNIGMSESQAVILDTETGVNYLWVRGTLGGGLTPLYDSNGDIMITKESKDD